MKLPPGAELVDDSSSMKLPAGAELVTDEDSSQTPTEDTTEFAFKPGDQHGKYRMKSPSGKDIDVGYENVMNASKKGYKIHPDDREVYANDYVADLQKKAKTSGRKGSEFINKPVAQHMLNPDTDLPQSYDVVKAGPEKWSLDWVKQKANNLTSPHAILDQLPTAGSIAGGAAGATAGATTSPITGPVGPIVGRVAGAGVGAGVGESARQKLETVVYPYEHRPSAEENKRRIAIEAGMGAAAEGAGLGGSKSIGIAVKPLQETALASEKAGVNLLPSEAAGKAPSFVERFMKGSVLTSGKMEKFRQTQNAETKAVVEKVANDISKFNGTPEELGNLVQDGIENHKKGFRVIQNQMYDDIATDVNERTIKVPVQTQVQSKVLDAHGKPVMTTVTKLEDRVVDDVMPSMKSLKDYAKEKMADLELKKDLLPKKDLEDSEELFKKIINSPDNVPFRVVKDIRSDYLEISRKLDEALSTKAGGFAKHMSGLFDESMMDAAEKSGIQGLPEKIRAANAFTANEHKMFEQALVEKIVKTKKPEAIATLIRNPNIGNQETRDLFAVLPKQLHQPVQRQIIMDTMRQSVNLNTKAFNERRFAETIAKIGDERGQIIFGPNWKNVKELTGIMERINGPVGIGASGGASLQNFALLKNAMLLAIPGGEAARGQYGSAAASLVGEWASLNLLASAMTHPATAVKMLKVAQGFARTLPYAGYVLGNVGRGEEIGKGETPDERRLDAVKQKAKDLQDKMSPTPAPVAQPAVQPVVPAPVAVPQMLYDEDGNPVGPQSSNQGHTHIWDAKTQSIVPV